MTLTEYSHVCLLGFVVRARAAVERRATAMYKVNQVKNIAQTYSEIFTIYN